MEDPAAKLVEELRSLLDEVTILSISSDYDLTNPQEFIAAREVLLAISKDVVAEEATGFNPSGLGVDDVVDINAANSGIDVETTNVAESDVKSNSGLTTTTESSQSLSLGSTASSKTSTLETPILFHVSVFDGLSGDEKENQLSQMFKSLKPIDIKLTLKRLKGDASLAIDELLNLQWLEETGQRLKGIDGFYVPDGGTASSKKKKGKKKKRPATEPSSPGPNSPSLAQPKEFISEEHNENITFLSERLQQPKQDVTDIYSKHNASLGATIVEVIDNYIALGLQSSDAEELVDIKETADKYSWVPYEYISGIFDTCHIRQYALDLIDVLGDYFEKPAYLKYDISYSTIVSKPEPFDVSNGNVAVSQAQAASKPIARQLSTSTARKHVVSRSGSLYSASTSSTELATARDHAYMSAASAYRKGRSNPLFKQANAYYVERGRELASNHRQAISAEAEYMVDQKSTKTMIDLHGVTVQDGVDIAKDRVSRWWDSLGEDRARKAKEGFTVVTGIGRHSSDGRSPLRINVFKALVADGWKIEVLTGSYLVTGRRRS